jgi:protein SCO1
MRNPVATRHGFAGRFAVIAWAAILTSLLGYTLAWAAQPNPFDQVVQPLKVGAPLPQLSLIDERGHTFTTASLRGNATVIGFIYTRCTDACPLITQRFVMLNHDLGFGPYRLLEVTIDPAYDTPPVLAAYARKQKVSGGRFSLATGNPDAIDRFVRAAGVGVIDGGHGDLIHNARLLVVSPDGRLNAVVEQIAWNPQTIAAQLRSLTGESSSPLARLDFQLTKEVAQLCGGSYQTASGIIDVIGVVLIVAAAVLVMLWVRRRVFEQGA